MADSNIDLGALLIVAQTHCPHAVRIRDREPLDFAEALSRSLEIDTWCREQYGRQWLFGLEDGVETARWFAIGSSYHFRDVNDAFWFKVAWN